MSSSLLVSGIGPIYKFEIENDGSELPLDYDVAAMETFFNKRPLEVMYRTGEIFAELLPYFTRAFIWEYLIRSVAGLVQIHYFDTYVYEQRTFSGERSGTTRGCSGGTRWSCGRC